MTNRTPELEHAKALLDAAELARGARERIYWRVVHRPERAAHGHWRLAVLVFGWLTAASAAYGLGRVVLSNLPKRAELPSIAPAAPLASSAVKRRAARYLAPSPTAPLPDAAENPTVPEARRATDSAAAASTRAGANDFANAATPRARLGETGNSAEPAGAAPAAATAATSVAKASAAPAGRLATSGGNADVASELSLQVAEYREAVALQPASPHAALERLYAHRRRWPSSSIAHEVDLRIIQSLLALGQTESARAAARTFLQHYPGSARREEVRRIAETND
jgi:hypothetical protein